MKSATGLWGKGEAVTHASGGGLCTGQAGGSWDCQEGFCALTCGHPGADWNALLVLQDGEHTDKVLHARLQLPDGGGCLVSRDPELHFQAILMGGRVHDEVLCDPHLIVPGQVYGLFCHFCHDEVFGRGHWQEKGRTAWVDGVSNTLYGSQQGGTWWVCILGDLGPLWLAGEETGPVYCAHLQNFWGPPLAFRVKFQVCSVAFNLFLFLGP